MNSVYILFIVLCSFALNLAPAYSEDATTFDSYMSIWNQNRELASEYLVRAEKALESGDEISACVAQQEASEYGIIATNALIKAFKINNDSSSITNLKVGLQKWKEIGNTCK